MIGHGMNHELIIVTRQALAHSQSGPRQMNTRAHTTGTPPYLRLAVSDKQPTSRLKHWDRADRYNELNAGAAMPWLKSYPDEVNWAENFPIKPAWCLLDDTAAIHGHRNCVDFQGRKLTYSEAKALSDRAAKGLLASGFKPGMKLGLLLPNCPMFVVFYHGCLKAGGTVVNFNPLYTESEIARQIEDSETDFMVTLDLKLLLSKATAMLDRTRLSKVVVASLAEQMPPIRGLIFKLTRMREIAAVPVSPAYIPTQRLLANDGVFARPATEPSSAIAVLQYTGGTTGIPKAAALTHANVYANAMQCKAWFYSASGPDNRVVGVLPLFHAFAMTSIMNWTLSVGGCIFLEPRFDARALLRLIHRKRPTALAGVPTLFTALLNSPDFNKRDLSSLKFCVSGGAPLPRTVREQFEARSGVGIWEGYGLSEASPVCSVNPMHMPSRAGSGGLPLPQTHCEVISLEDRTTVLEAGQTGEICFRGPQVMQSYWKNPAATADTLRNGRLHTGDVGHMDEDGFIYVTDRLKEMIIASGFKVYPRLVEEALYQHPAVLECAVYGVDDDYRGQTVKAVVCLKAHSLVSAEGLDGFLESRLSHIEKPKIYEFRDVLPKTAVGKIHKKALIDEDKMKQQHSPQDAP